MLYDLSNDFQSAQFNTRCATLLDKGCIVELTEKKQRRSISQNSYLHLILSYFALEYGESPEYVKRQYFKILCNADIFIRDKVDNFRGTIKVLRSSADLDTAEMSLAIERFRNWASKEAGIYLPDANEHLMIQQMEMELSRNKKYHV